MLLANSKGRHHIKCGTGVSYWDMKMPDDLLEKRSGHTQSVSRALSLLSKLSEEPDGFNLSELARRVKLAPSTAHRLLTTLQLDQFVRFEDGRWLVGVQASNVGSSYLRARDVSYMSRSYLRMMVQETGETANLALLENNELVYLAQNEYVILKIPDNKTIDKKFKKIWLPISQILILIRTTNFIGIQLRTFFSLINFFKK